MKNIVISLSTAQERRNHIVQEFNKQHIDFAFFDAITPAQIKDTADKLHIDLDHAPLTDSEKACLLSHVCLWQKMLDDDLDYLAIFEDDVYLGKNAAIYFNNTDWLKQNHLDFVKTETFLQNKKIKGSTPLMDNRTLSILQEAHLGTAGYIISQKAAMDLLTYLQNTPSEQILAIDHLMFECYLLKNHLPIYQINPALCIQEFILYPNQNTMPSSIEALRDERKKQKPKRSLYAKIKGELSNAHRKTLGKFIRTKIEFR